MKGVPEPELALVKRLVDNGGKAITAQFSLGSFAAHEFSQNENGHALQARVIDVTRIKDDESLFRIDIGVAVHQTAKGAGARKQGQAAGETHQAQTGRTQGCRHSL